MGNHERFLRGTAGELAISGEHSVFDHKRRLEVSALSIWGAKKTRFNGTDYGVIVGSSYAAAHT
jgi:hypothetical protein